MDRPLADSRPFGPLVDQGRIVNSDLSSSDVGFTMEMMYKMDTTKMVDLYDDLEDNINDLLADEYSVSTINDVTVLQRRKDSGIAVSVEFNKSTFTDPEEDEVIDIVNQELSRIGRDDAEFVTYKYYF